MILFPPFPEILPCEGHAMEDYLLLKAALVTEGIRSDPESVAEVGTLYKEQNHGLFGWDFENHIQQKLPDDFCLPDRTVVQYRLNSQSQYHVVSADNRLQLYKNEQPLCEVHWIRRPRYYDEKTTTGNDMIKVGQIGGKDCLFFCYQNYCSHFAKNQQCAFCNLVSTSKVYDSVMRKKDPVDVGEVVKAAWAEGDVNHVNLTGGCISPQREVAIVSEILASIREHTGFDTVPGTLLPSPAKGDTIHQYYETGIGSLCFAMEVWDKKYYEAICPGKAASTSHDEFVAGIKKAVETFGEGNVYTIFVMGLEPKETFLAGVNAISELGANVIPFVWSPNPGSKLAGHRAPFAEWYAQTNREAAQIVLDHGVPDGTRNHCYLCDGNSLLHDALREKGVV
jgi:biotin synthase-related radical SAM superfamily protein